MVCKNFTVLKYQPKNSHFKCDFIQMISGNTFRPPSVTLFALTWDHFSIFFKHYWIVDMRELRTRSCFAKLWKVTNCFHFFSAPHLPYPDPPTISSHSFLSEHAFVSPFCWWQKMRPFGGYLLLSKKSGKWCGEDHIRSSVFLLLVVLVGCLDT